MSPLPRLCDWKYPNSTAMCGAAGVQALRNRLTGEVRLRCLNHAQRDVWGGQWQCDRETCEWCEEDRRELEDDEDYLLDNPPDEARD